MKFQGKVALVTGSGTGIGQAIAKKFVENGASVIILGRRREPLEETKAMLDNIIKNNNSGARVIIFSGVDVSDEEGINKMFDSLREQNITVDFVINNAGVSGPVTCFSNAPLDEFKSAVDIHLTGTFWTSSQALKVMKPGGKIVTISTFFTEEKPYEQRPYRFRSPYTAAQGAKNRLAEAMSWEIVDKQIVSIATNPGPVHSDRIYKTVYPKAAAEFMRVSGFENLTPKEVENASKEILPLLGEDESTVTQGIEKAAQKIAAEKKIEPAQLVQTLTKLLEKIQTIAEKVQNNTSHMIADKQFLSQPQVAETVLNLCDDEIGKILNGKVIPGDRVFYPVKPHVGTRTPGVHQPDFKGRSLVITAEPTDIEDVERVLVLAEDFEKNGGRAVCFVSNKAAKEFQEKISNKVHSHSIDLSNPSEIKRWFETANKNLGSILVVTHVTGKVPDDKRFIDLTRNEWDELVSKFIITPATVMQGALEHFVPEGRSDPRKFKDTKGTMMIIGPDLPSGKKVSGESRARVEVFRGALRPFTTTTNQELSDVLGSKARIFLVLPGSVAGTESNNKRISEALNYFVSDYSESSSEVIFCVDETR